MTKIDKEMALKMRDEGMSIKDIAKEFDVTYQAVYNFFRDYDKSVVEGNNQDETAGVNVQKEVEKGMDLEDLEGRTEAGDKEIIVKSNRCPHCDVKLEDVIIHLSENEKVEALLCNACQRLYEKE